MGGVVAIMQPYFMPYAGYFRLLCASDLFVVYDDVQFPRRGYVHRNRLPASGGEADWLTLSLAPAPRETAIRDMRFSADSAERLARAARRFPTLARHADHSLVRQVTAVPPGGPLVDHLVALLESSCARMRLPFNVVRSSTLPVDAGLAGESRLIAIARALGASDYVNAPGGRELYDAENFRRHGLRLRLLEDYRGSNWSMLERLLTEPAETLRREIASQC